MKKFIFIVIILGILLGAAGFWYWNRNSYSKEILKLEILGPEQTPISQEVEYTVKYKNNGDVKLEEPRLIFEFPNNTLLENDSPKRIEMGPEELGDIYPGEEKSFKFKGWLLGKEGEVKTAKAWLNYHPKNIKARYESATTLSTTIESVPLTLDFDLSSKVEAGRDFKFSINYFSNLDYPLTNLGIKVEYPSDFEFIGSTPKTIEKTEWDIPLLNKAEGGRIEIIGKLSGEVKEQKIFKAALGIWIEDEFILLKEITRGVEITESQLSIFQQINGQNQYIASSGDLLHYEIYFRNISTEPFKDLFLVTKLDGQGFDLETTKTEAGQLKEGDNSIIWDWRTVPKLRFLGQGEEGKVEFWVNQKDQWQITSPEEKNAILKNTVLISQAKEEFEIKINSKLEISQQVSQEGDIYTVIWTAKNYFNDVKNVKARAVLPPGVALTGKIFPESESSNFSFDSQSREIVWSIGDGQAMKAGAGILNPAPNIAFQLDLTGEFTTIINEAIITGEDQWTESFIQGEASDKFFKEEKR